MYRVLHAHLGLGDFDLGGFSLGARTSARAVVAGEMTGGQLASFVLYAGIVAGSVGVIAEVWGDMQRAAGATERLMELLHAHTPIASPAAPAVLPLVDVE